MIPLVFLVLVFSDPGFSNFRIFQGHKSPGQALCCTQTGSAPSFTIWELHAQNSGGQRRRGRGKFILLISCLSGRQDFPPQFSKETKASSRGRLSRMWCGRMAGCTGSQKSVRGESHPSRPFPKAITPYPDSFPINKTPMITMML